MSWSNPISKAGKAIVDVGQKFAEGVSNAAGLVLTPDAVIATILNNFKFPLPGLPSGGTGILGIPNPFDFIKNFIEGLAKVINNLVVNILDKLDAVVTGGIAKAQVAALTTIRAFEDTANRIITKATDAFSNLLNQAMQSLKKILDDIFEDVKQIIGNVNDYVKDRIEQVGTIIAESLDSVRDIVNDFTPQNIYKELVGPAFEKIGKLQEQLFEDINKLLDKIIEKQEQLIRGIQFNKDVNEIPRSSIGRKTLKELNLTLSDLKISSSTLFAFWEAYFKNLKAVDKNITAEENCAISDDLRKKASLMRFLDLEKSITPNDFLATKWLEYSIEYNTQISFAGLNTTLTPGNAPSFLAKKLEELLKRYKPNLLERILPI